MTLQIFLEAPKGFISDLAVVGCYCQYQDTFLLLKRHPKCFSGKKWCLPGGKLNEGEARIEGARRELHEEAGVALVPKDLSHFLTFYLDRGDLKYDFTVYHCIFEKRPQLQIHLQEHTEGRWVTHEDATTLPLIAGGNTVLDYCLQKRGDLSI